MKCEWTITTIEQCTSVLGDGLHGTPKYTENGEYAFINGNNLIEGKIHIKKDTKRVDETQYKKYKKPLNNRTIMVSINGTLGNVGLYNDEKIILGKSACYFNINEDIDKLFIYYIIKSPDFKNYLESNATGTTIKNISLKQMKEYEFKIPHLETQHRIASILSALDNKIELNNKINENLELQAQAIFKDWFVGSDDCQPATIADISVNVTDGVHNTVKDDINGNYLLLSCKNIKGGNLSIGNNERHINKETFDKLRKRTHLAKGDILLSSVGTIGEIFMLNTEPCNFEFQRSVAMIKPNADIVSSAYVYESLLYRKAELINSAHGAVQQCLFISDISEFPIDIPSKYKLDKFNSIVIPIFDTITANQQENQQLAALRDTLLPKLMNGEIDVSEVKI